MLLTFFEPSNYDENYSESLFIWTTIIESLILTFFIVDMIVKMSFRIVAAKENGS
jgi:hypothetical protein